MIRFRHPRTLLTALILVAMAVPVNADMPQIINYQGRLFDSTGTAVDGPVTMVFTIYWDSTGGTGLWTSGEQEVIVTDGLFSYMLGSANPVPDSIFVQDSICYLGIAVGSVPKKSSGEEITPRTMLASVPYAFRAWKSRLCDTCNYCLNCDGADNDWIIDGDNIYHPPALVGVGTTAPTAKFDVNVPGSEFYDPLNVRYHETSQMIVKADGNVGIGAAVPDDKLDVDGDIRVRGADIKDAGGTVRITMTQNGNLDLKKNDGTAVLSIDTDGEVGIGTDSPVHELEVRGDIGFDDFLYHNDNTTTNIGFTTDQIDLYAGGVRMITTDESTQDAVVINDDGGDIDFRVEAVNETYGLFVRGSDGLVGIGESSPSAKLQVNADATIDPLRVRVSGTTKMIVKTDGSVGIGILTPEENLDVNGTVKMTGFKMPEGASAGYVLTSDADGVGTWEQSAGGLGGEGTSGRLAKFTGTTTLGNSVVYESGTGNIGIGIPSSTYKLDVQGNAMIRGDINSPGALTILDTLYVGSRSRLKDDLDVDGDLRIGGGDVIDAAGVERISIADAGRLSLKEDGGSIAMNVLTDGTVEFPDSTMRVGPNGITVGTSEAPESGILLKAERHYNTGDTCYGLKSELENAGAGTMYGFHSSVLNTAAKADDTTYAVFAKAESDGDIVFGIDVHGITRSPTNNTSLTYGIHATADGGARAAAFYGWARNATTNWGGYFNGDIRVTGDVVKSKSTTQIDHPLDPENKYLFHCQVESPEMKTVYDGIAVLDAAGEAAIQLPDYFETLNRDFRYQLTCVGGYAPVYVSEKISDNRFRIAGGRAGMEVSWQVTGIRNDAYAQANQTAVETDKPAEERGKYIHPEVFGFGEEYSVDYDMRPEIERKP